MTTMIEAFAAVFDLALAVEDIEDDELAAMTVAAKWLDREINKQTATNPLLGARTTATLRPCPHPTLLDGQPAKNCPVCRGDGEAWVPDIGWSRRVSMLAAGRPPVLEIVAQVHGHVQESLLFDDPDRETAA